MSSTADASARFGRGRGAGRGAPSGGERVRGRGRGAPGRGRGSLPRPQHDHDAATATTNTRGRGMSRGSGDSRGRGRGDSRGRGRSASFRGAPRPAPTATASASASSSKKPDSSKFFASDSEDEEQRQEQDEASSVESNEEEEEEEEEEEDVEAVFRRPTLSLSGHPLPSTKDLSKTLSRFARLTKLELSGMQPSADSPNGLDSLEWLGAATSLGANADERFGSRLTTLDVSENPNLNNEGAWKGLESLQRLFVLNATSCALTRLPPSALLPGSLRALILNHNSLASLPDLPFLPQLNTLVISHNKLTSLPPSLPAALPALKKLSASHNQLHSAALPDLSACAHLREVRLAGNPLGNLPSHIAEWGKGVGSEAKGTGLETLELAECKLAKWEHVSALIAVPHGEQEEPSDTAASKRKRGIRNLSFKGNHIASLDDYREKILAAQPTLAILDGVPIVTRPPKRPAGFPTDEATADNISDSEAEDVQSSAARSGKDRARDRAGPAPSDAKSRRGVGDEKGAADARMRSRAGPPPPSDDQGRSDKKRRERAGPPPADASRNAKRLPLDKDARARQRAGPPPPADADDAAPPQEDDRHKPHKRGVRGAKRKRGDVEEIIAEDPTAERAAAAAAARAGPPPPIVEPGVASDSDDSDAGGVPTERKKQKRAKRGKGSAAAERKREVARMDVDGEDLVRDGDDVSTSSVKKRKKDKSTVESGDASDKSQRKKLKTAVPVLGQAWDAGSPALPAAVVAPTPAAAEEVPAAKPERTSVVGIVDVRKKAGGAKGTHKAVAKSTDSAAPSQPAAKANVAAQADKPNVWGEGAGEAWGSGAGGGAWS